ncbi:MAG: hypothetical protein Unbinned5081contig1001_39 [Prokaryotic dsDNA virus sp.]|nr:MAG: hypothetical protein Unbinned5081contig1001_39 [Prokaryotic dsDNA virus sp.]|tara:strand:- start:19414 stop:19830 length:417 start_codon:yes stop_codon:yes gene_type:complete
MDNSTIVLLINDDARVIRGQYEDGGKITNFKTLDQGIKVDDMIVVESSTRHGMTVVKVVETDIDINFDTETDVRWVVQKIDTKNFATVLDQEKEAIATVQSAERRRKKEALRKSVFAEAEDRINTLQLANMGGEDVTE